VKIFLWFSLHFINFQSQVMCVKATVKNSIIVSNIGAGTAVYVL